MIRHQPFVGRVTALGVALILIADSSAEAAVRIKDLGHFDGVRPNQLIGYGLVVGLDGTGDSDRASFTPQSLEAMLARLGVRVDKRQLMLRNVAAVSVTAELPAFARPGVVVDANVSSIGDARSIAGGTLLMTPLVGGNGETYAVAQGPLQVGSASREGQSRGSGAGLNAGRVQSGAIVEREIPVTLGKGGALRFSIRRPDFGTARSLAEVINRLLPPLLGGAAPAAELASQVDAGTVQITVPAGWETRLGALIALVEGLEAEPDSVARVIVSRATGSVVLGGQVRLSRAAIAYEGIAVDIAEAAPAAPVRPGQEPVAFKIVDDGATLADVVRGLNALGVKARGLIDILQALSAAGALHAQIEVRP